MVYFCLNDDFVKTDEDAERLLRELRRAQTQPVYRTYVPIHDSEKKIILCTTNEKVHLAIGKISDPGQMVLARLFEEKLKGIGELVFSFQPDENQTQSRNLFVTASQDARGYRTFHIAPGH